MKQDANMRFYSQLFIRYDAKLFVHILLIALFIRSQPEPEPLESGGSGTLILS